MNKKDMILAFLVVAVTCGLIIGFDEIFRYWRVVALNL